MQRYGVSERFACQALGVHRSNIRRKVIKSNDEELLVQDIARLAERYGRYGYRLKVPQKQPKRKRLYLNDGSCTRLRPLYPNHVWSYDFVADRLRNGKKIRLLTIIDEYTREGLSIRLGYQLKSLDVLDELSTLFLTKGRPAYIRSDNGSEFTATDLQKWLRVLDITTAYIEPGSPWENGYNERFNSMEL